MAFLVKFADFEIEGIHEWKPTRKNKVSHLSLPRRHGTLIPDVAFSDELIINLSGEIWRDTETELRDYFDDLGARLMNFGKDRLYLRDDGRFLYAICSGTMLPNFEAARLPTLHAQYSLEFTAGDPFWYSAIEASHLEYVTTTPQSWSLTNNGKMRTPARVHITANLGPKRDVRVTNTTTGLFMRYRGTIAENQTLIMDSDRSSCQNNGLNDLNQFEGNFFLLEQGVNNITYVGATETQVDIYWRERFVQ